MDGRLIAADDLKKTGNLMSYGEKEIYEKGMKRYRKSCFEGQGEAEEQVHDRIWLEEDYGMGCR